MHCKHAGQSVSAFVNGFESSSGSRSICVATFLTPALLRPQTFRGHLHQTQRHENARQQFRDRRKYSTVAVASQSFNATYSKELSSKNDVHHPQSSDSHVSKPKDLRKDGSRNDVRYDRAKLAKVNLQSVVALVEPYLPPELRSGTWIEKLAGFRGVRSVETLPDVLSERRAWLSSQKIDRGILSLLALNLKRWDSFHFMVKELVSMKETIPSTLPVSDLYSDSPNFTFMSEFSLKDVTQIRPPPSIPRVSADSHKSLHGTDAIFERMDTARVLQHRYESGIGEIWMTLGEILIDSESMVSEERDKVLSQVHRALAFLHSQGLVHERMYESDSELVPLDRRKSPYLRIMSSRVMAVMSDAVWDSEETNHTKHTPALPPRRETSSGRSPRVYGPKPLGVELWLELVLWGCVHGGHFVQAAHLISQAAIFSPRSTAWTMASWEDIEALASKRAADKQQAYEAQNWFLWLTGASEGRGDEESLIALPPRTISSEVVLRVVEGNLKPLTVMKPPDNLLSTLLALLERPQAVGSDLPPKSFFESFGQGELSFLGFALNKLVETSSKSKRKYMDINLGASQEISAAKRVGIIRTLMTTIENGELYASLAEYDRLYRSTSSASTTDLIEPADTANTNTVLDLPPDTQPTMTVPDSILAETMELSVQYGRIDIAHQIMFGNSSHGPLVPQDASRMPVFHAALLHFASATVNISLMDRVTHELETSLWDMPSDTLMALTASHARLNKFANVRRLLKHMCFDRRLVPGPEITIAVASQLMNLSHGQSEIPPQIEDLSAEAASTLKDLLSLRFFPPGDPSKSKLADLSAKKLVNKLAQVLASLDGQPHEIASEHTRSSGRLARTQELLSTRDFNILLIPVLKTLGIQAAMRLVDRWAFLPKDKDRRSSGKARLDAAFVPNADTVHIFLRALGNLSADVGQAEGSEGAGASAAGQEQGGELSKDTIRWSVALLRRLEVEDEEIGNVLNAYGELVGDASEFV